MSEFEFPAGNRKWKREFILMLKGLDNDSLFDRVMEEQGPDGYDGCFSDQQMWKASVSMDYLVFKLKQSGFLTPDFKTETP